MTAANTAPQSIPHSSVATRAEMLKEFLNIFWLRPENALLLALKGECLATTLAPYAPTAQTLDVGCGDGLFSFISLGGQIGYESDMFQSLGDIPKFRNNTQDPYDNFDESYQIAVTQTPSHTFSVGTDLKKNSLERAKVLNLYEELAQHDSNMPLPYEEGTFDYIYSNTSYFIKNFEAHLNDMIRVLKPGGTLALSLFTNQAIEITAANYAPNMGEHFHKIIDGGRHEAWPILQTHESLTSTLSGLTGADLIESRPIFGDLMAMIWDVGLRPLFRPLSKMANALPPEKRIEVKQEWCEILFNLLKDYTASYEADFNTSVENLYILKKSA